MSKEIIVEVCCSCAEDAILAHKAGADRIELCSMIEIGGLTPSFGEFILAQSRIDIPIACLVRPRGGGFCYDEYEYETILNDAQLFTEAGAEGIVLGFLKENGSIDLERTQGAKDNIKGAALVFHKAFDCCADDTGMIASLEACGVDRLLTAGRSNSALEGTERLREYVAACRDMSIVAGGGIRKTNVAEVVELGGVNQVHLALNGEVQDMSASHNPVLQNSFSQWSYKKLNAFELEAFIDEVRNLQ